VCQQRSCCNPIQFSVHTQSDTTTCVSRSLTHRVLTSGRNSCVKTHSLTQRPSYPRKELLCHVSRLYLHSEFSPQEKTAVSRHSSRNSKVLLAAFFGFSNTLAPIYPWLSVSSLHTATLPPLLDTMKLERES
jgi:hypothetical protein